MKKYDISAIIRQSYDLHVHIGPEIIPRKYTVNSLIQEEAGKIAGIALKNHFYATTPLIAAGKGSPPTLFGSVVLNNFIGGLNPDAVYAMSLVAKTRCIVWFPTTSASQFLKNSTWEIAPEWVNNKKIAVRKAASISGITVTNKNASEVLKAIKITGSVLATGHISWQESEKLIILAKKMGINRIIVTHPIYQRINMPIAVQKKLAALGAFMEQSYSMYSIDGVSMKDISRQIKMVGAKNCILTSDVGQAFSASPSAALAEFARLLVNEGITYKELRTMLITNPKILMKGGETI